MNLDATLNRMTVAELRKLAAQFNIVGRSKMTKAQLVRELSDPDVVELSISLDEADEREMNEIRAEIAAEPVGVEAVADMIVDRTANYPTGPNEVAILRDAPGRAIVTAAFDGKTVGGSIIRKGKRLVLRAGNITVTGNTFDKVAKRLASKLGFRADIIDVARNF